MRRHAVCLRHQTRQGNRNKTIKIPDDDVIKWKHYLRYWPFVPDIHQSPVNSLHKGQSSGALIFSLICAWWFEAPSHPLWCHCNVKIILSQECIFDTKEVHANKLKPWFGNWIKEQIIQWVINAKRVSHRQRIPRVVIGYVNRKKIHPGLCAPENQSPTLWYGKHNTHHLNMYTQNPVPRTPMW